MRFIHLNLYDSHRLFCPGMLMSYNSGPFQVACLRFLNKFVETANTLEQKVFLQVELQEAGMNNTELDSLMLKVNSIN